MKPNEGGVGCGFDKSVCIHWFVTSIYLIARVIKQLVFVKAV